MSSTIPFHPSVYLGPSHGTQDLPEEETAPGVQRKLVSAEQAAHTQEAGFHIVPWRTQEAPRGPWLSRKDSLSSKWLSITHYLMALLCTEKDLLLSSKTGKH